MYNTAREASCRCSGNSPTHMAILSKEDYKEIMQKW